MTEKTSDPLLAVVLTVMRRWRREGALWTSDIAYGAKLPTAMTRRKLEALEKVGAVRRVVTGNPTSWELADEPSA